MPKFEDFSKGFLFHQGSVEAASRRFEIVGADLEGRGLLVIDVRGNYPCRLSRQIVMGQVTTTRPIKKFVFLCFKINWQIYFHK